MGDQIETERLRLRVLQLPINVASQVSTTVRALREVGVQAKGLVWPGGALTSDEGIEYLIVESRRTYLASAAAHLRRYSQIVAAIAWADVVHWYFDWSMPAAIDLRLARLAGRKLVVEFSGSDIRIPEVEAADNRYYSEVMHAQEYRGFESYLSSRRRQERFAAARATPIVPYESLLPYVQPDLFPEVHVVRHRIAVRDYRPMYPNPHNKCPVVLHSPSAPIIKGTQAIKDAVGVLQGSHSFEFRLAQGVPHTEAKRLMESCDIYIDQLVLGAHGVASLEAMACGKPVICYIKPSVVRQYPPDLPIVNATRETLPSVLSQLLRDGDLRRELGEQSRAYVEKHHDAPMLARKLVDLYGRL